MNSIFDKISGSKPDPIKTSDSSETQSTSEEMVAQNDHSTSKVIKETTQELLRTGCVQELLKPAVFRQAITHETAINQVLEPLDLTLKLDTHRGVAWLIVKHEEEQSPDETWSHPLIRRQRLTLEQSLLIALLRQAFAMHEQKNGIGQGAVKVSVDELLPQFMTYFQDTGSDSKNESKLLSLLDQLKTYLIVSEVDKNQEITIRPIITHLANPESLTALLSSLRALAEQ